MRIKHRGEKLILVPGERRGNSENSDMSYTPTSRDWFSSEPSRCKQACKLHSIYIITPLDMI